LILYFIWYQFIIFY